MKYLKIFLKFYLLSASRHTVVVCLVALGGKLIFLYSLGNKSSKILNYFLSVTIEKADKLDCKYWRHEFFFYLNISFMRAFVTVHTLYRGFVFLPHVDAEKGSSPHRVLHTGVVGWQIHPAYDEQPINLKRFRQVKMTET